MITVLMYGHDVHLMKIRSLLFKASGYHTLTVTTLKELISIAQPVELLILCHTLSVSECTQATRIASDQWPGVRELALIAWNADSRAQTSKAFYTIGGPAKLLSIVHQLVSSTPVPV